MGEPAILFAKPGAVAQADKSKLRKIGVVVVEVENLDDVKLIYPQRPEAELPHGDLLAAYARAMSDDDFGSVKKAFAEAVAASLLLRHGSRQ